MVARITIVGGGLSGLVLGILLRRREIPVTVFEAGHYPRHRVCGEFISGRGLDLFRQERLLENLPQVENRTVRFHLRGRATQVLALPQPALSISRWDLDAHLARVFESLGGELRAGTRWDGGFAEGVIRATGRRPAAQNSGPRYIGLKFHARMVAPGADLELHFSGAGYAGLARLPDETVNICGLFKSDAAIGGARHDPAAVFDQILGEPLRAAVVPESFCSVAGVETASGRWPSTAEFRLGDAISVIPPLTGNGMSLAVESAFLAEPTVAEFARGAASWEQSLWNYSQTCKKSFRSRLWWSSLLQKSLFSERGGSVLMSCLRTVPSLLPTLFRATR